MKLRDCGLEGIDHQYDSTFGAEIEVELKKLRALSIISDNSLNQINLEKVIKKHTGLTVKISTEHGIGAYVYPPDIDKNNPILQNWSRRWLKNEDSKEVLANKDFMEGVVNLKTGKVHGDFSLLTCCICIGSDLLRKGSMFTVSETAAIVLHEIGHIEVYFEMLGRHLRTNYILSEGTKRLLTTNNKEQRIALYNEVENATNTKIDDKEKLAEKALSEKGYQLIIISASVKQCKQELNVNLYDTRAFEQLADNYVTRHGYARALALGLDKLHRMGFDNAYLSPMLNTLLNIAVVLYTLVKLVVVPASALLLIMELLVMGNPLAVTYDPPKKRILKLKQQINDALKDTRLTKERKQIFLNDYKEIEAVLDGMYHNSSAYELIWGYVLPWGIKQRKMIEVQEELENLHNNDLFTAAAALSNK